jgi:predicted RNase H-like nuclease (RuvC/YqgF family)
VQLHVFAGAVELDVRSQKLRLPEGESCIVSDGAQPVTTQALRDRIKQLQRTVSDGDVALSQLYEKLCAHYSKRLAELRAEAGPHELAYRQERIALLENLLAAHTKAFETLQAKKPDIPDLKAAQTTLGHLDDLRREAESVRERLARLLADHPASSEQAGGPAP